MPNQPSGVYTTQQLAEKSLERIGAYTVNSTGADSVELRRTLEWMDLGVAELAESEECQWLRPVDVDQTLTANDGTYTLTQFVNYPAQGITHPAAAYISTDSGVTFEPIELWRKEEYDRFENKATTGTPQGVYIDRLAEDKNVYVYPVPTISTCVLRLVVQTFAPDVRGGEGNLTGNIDHKFPRAWQLWLILRTAFLISGGPVRKLDSSDRREIAEEASASLGVLTAYQNREKVGQLRRTQPWGRG